MHYRFTSNDVFEAYQLIRKKWQSLLPYLTNTLRTNIPTRKLLIIRTPWCIFVLCY